MTEKPNYSFLSNCLKKFLKNLLLSDSFTQPASTCSKLTIKTLEQSVKYVNS